MTATTGEPDQPVRERFTAVEWTLLTELPIRVVAAAAGAEPTGGLGAITELTTGLAVLSAGTDQYGHNPLIEAVFADYKRDGSGEAEVLALSERWVETLLPDTIERARQIAALLAAKADPRDAAEYKQWLLEVAAAIANASTTGGFLGFGGQRVTDAEQGFLSALTAALTTSHP